MNSRDEYAVELQPATDRSGKNAVEIAGAPQVRDRQTLAHFYLGMGENALSSGQYDSTEARVTEDRVKRELIGSSAYRSASADRSRTHFKNQHE